MTASPHWQAAAQQADSKPGRLEELLGTLFIAESKLQRMQEAGLYLSPRQAVIRVQEVQ